MVSGSGSLVGPELEISCQEAVADRFAAAPTVVLRLRVREVTGASVLAVALHCQVRLEPLRRTYDDTEAALVVDLFGERPRWSSTMHALQLGYVDRVVPGFEGTSVIELPLALSYDVDVAAHKYLAALRGGDIPLLLRFSGQVFAAGATGLAVHPIAWHTEASARLPVAAWREAMDAHFPGQAWLRVSRDTYDRLARRRSQLGLAGWDALLSGLLEES